MPANQNEISPASPGKERNALTVSQLNSLARRLLEEHFASVWVEGELSNFSRPSSGHWYFSIKDANAQIRCAMFRNANARLRFNPESGQHVLVRARLSLYEARGDYQLIVEHMEPFGTGALALAFEQLKEKLQREGLFDASRKKPLPTLPRHIAVITSPTGAAIRDILTVLARRFPAIPVTIIPVAVQGEQAAPEIAEAIELANTLAAEGRFDFDVILTGRGGGSLEDLWAFNEEIVARAIARSELPVVSAVGHEVDVTIADFVADVRAPTPSAAAELISPDQREMLETLLGYEELLSQQVTHKVETLQRELKWLRSRLRHPGSRLQEHSQRLDELELRLRNNWRHQQHLRQHQLALCQASLRQHSPASTFVNLELRIDNLYRRLQQNIQRQLERRQQRFRSSCQLLETVSPLATLNRGYSITSDEQQQILRSTEQLKPGDQIQTRLARGQVYSRVETIED